MIFFNILMYKDILCLQIKKGIKNLNNWNNFSKIQKNFLRVKYW